MKIYMCIRRIFGMDIRVRVGAGSASLSSTWIRCRCIARSCACG
jgi:hypothetical protein